MRGSTQGPKTSEHRHSQKMKLMFRCPSPACCLLDFGLLVLIFAAREAEFLVLGLPVGFLFLASFAWQAHPTKQKHTHMKNHSSSLLPSLLERSHRSTLNARAAGLVTGFASGTLATIFGRTSSGADSTSGCSNLLRRRKENNEH